jgi:DNA repair protein RecO (recombination protein O)
VIVKTEAIVLKTMKYGESSKILTLYTLQYGKLSVIAKGARGPKSKFGSALEPMNHVLAVFYKKENRDLSLLSQCDLLGTFRHLSDDMDRMHAAMSIIALIDAVSHAEEENAELFRLALHSLGAVNDATKNAINVFYIFEIRLAGIAGFKPDFRVCARCGSPLDGKTIKNGEAKLYMAAGGVACRVCSEAGIGRGTISASAVAVLQALQKSPDVRAVTEISLDARLREEIGTTLQNYLASHIEGLKVLKTEKVFAAIS